MKNIYGKDVDWRVNPPIEKFFSIVDASEREQARKGIDGDEFYATAAWRESARWLWDQLAPEDARGNAQARKLWPYVLASHLKGPLGMDKYAFSGESNIKQAIAFLCTMVGEEGGIKGVTSSPSEYSAARDAAKQEILTHGPDLQGAASRAADEQKELYMKTGHAGPFTDALLFELLQFGADRDVNNEWESYCKRTARAERLTPFDPSTRRRR